MVGFVQPLGKNFAVVDPQTGLPTDYFIRWAQEKQIDITKGIDASTAKQIADEEAALALQSRHINTTAPIVGGGSLGADLTLAHGDSGVTSGTYGSSTKVPVISVDSKGHLTNVTETIITGGGGSGGSSEAPFIAPPPASTWIHQNFNATNTSLVDFSLPCTGVRLIEAAVAYGNTNSVRYALTPIPTTSTWTITARLRRGAAMSSYMAWGIVVRDSATGQSRVFGFDWEAGGLGALRMSSDTAYTGYTNYGAGSRDSGYYNDIWVRLRYTGNGNSCIVQFSNDGYYWFSTFTYAATTNSYWIGMTNPPTHVGFGFNSNNNGAGSTYPGQDVALLSWEVTT